MTDESLTAKEQSYKRNSRPVRETLHENLINAVRIVSAHLDVPGSVAYPILVQAAKDLRVSVPDLAKSIVGAPDALDWLMVPRSGL